MLVRLLPSLVSLHTAVAPTRSARAKRCLATATAAGKKKILPKPKRHPKELGIADDFEDDPAFQSFFRSGKFAEDDDEGPDPTPEELAEEDKLAESVPLSPGQIRAQEEFETQVNENILSFVDMDEITQKTEADFYEKPLAVYKGTFNDKRGEVPCEVTRSENELTMKIRGFRFLSTDMVSWELPGSYAFLARDAFTLANERHKTIGMSEGAEEAYREGPRKLLDKFTVDFTVPLSLAHLDEEGKECETEVQLRIRVVRDVDQFDDGIFKLFLALPTGEIFESSAASRFSDAIFDIQRQLPRLQYVKNCWGCANAEFSPLQPRPYGGMACFSKKPKYLTFRTNSEVVRNWSKVTGIVQELHLCPSFRRRTSKRPEPINAVIDEPAI